jgi:hypothetical protein
VTYELEDVAVPEFRGADLDTVHAEGDTANVLDVHAPLAVDRENEVLA